MHSVFCDTGGVDERTLSRRSGALAIGSGLGDRARHARPSAGVAGMGEIEGQAHLIELTFVRFR